MWANWPVPCITRFGVGPALVAHLRLAQLTVLPGTSKEQTKSALHLCLDVMLFPGGHSLLLASSFTSFPKFTCWHFCVY